MSLLHLYLKSASIKKKSKQSEGFTLIELLVAIAMASIVILALGAGMVALLRSTKTNAAKTELKNQLNRALDYINEDLKNARVAGIDTSQDLDGDGNDDEALVLTYFDDDLLSATQTPKTIRYFLSASTDADPWLGPNLLMRLEDPEGDGFADNTAQVLVDGISDTIETSELPDGANFCNGLTGTTTANGGFQACVESATATNNSPLFLTTVVLASEVNDVRVAVNTDTIARSITPSLDPPELAFSPETDLTPDLTWEAVLGASNYSIYECFTTTTQCTPNTGSDLLQGGITGTSLSDNTEPTATNRACYAAIASNGTVSSPLGTPICTIISPSAVPSDTSDLVASDNIQPTVTWTREDDAIEYDLYRCPTPDPSSPCLIDPATDTPISTFTATTQAEFDLYVPWYETNNTDETPPDNQAFCYAVVSRNVRGDSNLSNVDCGAVNIALTLNNSWTVAFGTFPSGTTPQNITWNNISGATQYRLNRCMTTDTAATDCDPTTQADAEIIVSTNSFNEDTSTPPSPGEKYCYAVRAESATEMSAYSSVECGEQEPPLCELDMQALGLGFTINRQSSADSSARQTLINVVTTAKFESLSFEKLADPTGFSAYAANELYQVYANGSDARNGDNQITLTCDTPITFRWHYSDDFVYPPSVSIVTASPASNPDEPIFSWETTADADRYDVYRCETGLDTCDPASGGIITTSSTSGSYNTDTGSGNQRPSNNNRYCYGVIAVDTDPATDVSSTMSDVLCGELR